MKTKYWILLTLLVLVASSVLSGCATTAFAAKSASVSASLDLHGDTQWVIAKAVAKAGDADLTITGGTATVYEYLNGVLVSTWDRSGDFRFEKTLQAGASRPKAKVVGYCSSGVKFVFEITLDTSEGKLSDSAELSCDNMPPTSIPPTPGPGETPRPTPPGTEVTPPAPVIDDRTGSPACKPMYADGKIVVIGRQDCQIVIYYRYDTKNQKYRELAKVLTPPSGLMGMSDGKSHPYLIFSPPNNAAFYELASTDGVTKSGLFRLDRPASADWPLRPAK